MNWKEGVLINQLYKIKRRNNDNRKRKHTLKMIREKNLQYIKIRRVGDIKI